MPDSENLAALDRFFEQGLITEVLYRVKSGKEATVYCCAAHPSTGVEFLAAKVYCPREARSFKNDAVYQDGRYIDDARLRRAAAKKTRAGRAAQFDGWLGQEYSALQTLYAAGADVPRPYSRSGSALLLTFVGDADGPAPLLQKASVPPDQAPTLCERLLHNIRLWLLHDLVHADLSPFNILYWQEQVTVIDFPQSVDARTNRNAAALLGRDVANVCQYFARYGVETDPDAITARFWRAYIRGELRRLPPCRLAPPASRVSPGRSG